MAGFRVGFVRGACLTCWAPNWARSCICMDSPFSARAAIVGPPVLVTDFIAAEVFLTGTPARFGAANICKFAA